MALPQKKRGFRKIMVEGKEFNWRLTQPHVEVCPVICKDNKLVVDFGGYDVWLRANDGTQHAPNSDLWVVTPSFIRSTIQFALSNNWDVAKKACFTNIRYRNKQFSMV
jgi:hypothetical protein